MLNSLLAALLGRRGTLRYFRDQAFHFQTLRALNNVRADGADTAEVLETIGHIREGDVHGWYDAWESMATRVLASAVRIGDARSRGQAFLRGHNYLRTAEFFLEPTDPKRPSAFRRSVEAFDAGLDATEVARERMRVPYGDHHLNAIFYPGPPEAKVRPLLVLCGGFDSTLEELYFVLVPAAHERGFAVLTFEGPGQGAVLREQKLVFTHEWERPTSAVLDAHFALHPPIAKTVLIGMSMGGYLAPRAVAFDRRIDGVVAVDALFDLGAIAKQNIPRFAWWLHAHHAGLLLDALIAVKSRLSPGFAWLLANAKWVLGTASPMESVEAMGRYTLAPIAGRIEADVLLLIGAEDHFAPSSQAAELARALTAARSVRSIVYDRASGGAAHCQMGAQSLWHADLFDWLADIETAQK